MSARSDWEFWVRRATYCWIEKEAAERDGNPTEAKIWASAVTNAEAMRDKLGDELASR